MLCGGCREVLLFIRA
ncbi:hypothetical protein GBB54_08610 [Bifidobacterium longum]|uniref:Uncharacterized protein n=2 Tax=Bifidobacterium longum TaxID=216816 RepID=A0A6I1DJT6_BIFLN|nr:hypothetical protein GBB79_06520 [Bifidobacterium longum]MBM5829316.1 hypothetical protein [Bifidobacterium longum subsp. suillum]MDN4189131.1 hypothetical protein [Bifidobacterium longum subsp. longum]THJ29786.1 hypothetical protein E6L38_04985 [Bifidobacterium longum subsp. infantis]KAB7330264.1 hypothetical protein GBB71_07050 [Bifidobacterium longum]